MRAARIIRIAHAWSGATLSLLLAAMGLSGFFLVFRDDYLRAAFPAARQTVPTDPSTLARLSENAEHHFGAGMIRTLRFPPPDFGLVRVRLVSGESAYLDSNGSVVAFWDGHDRLDDWIFDLHHHLLLGDRGEVLIGIAGICLFCLVVTGIYTVWPARRSLGLAVLPRSTKRRDLLSSHRNLGLWAALPLLMLSLTGVGMVFPEQAKALLSPGSDKASQAPSATSQPPPVDTVTINWHLLLANAQHRFPDATIRGVTLPPPGESDVRVRLRQPSEWQPNGRTYIDADTTTSAIVAVDDALRASAGTQAFNAFYPIHSARFGHGLAGRLYDLVIAAAGLSLFLLGLVGTYSFLTKSRRTHRR